MEGIRPIRSLKRVMLPYPLPLTMLDMVCASGTNSWVVYDKVS
jgi:hypothetical protein